MWDKCEDEQVYKVPLVLVHAYFKLDIQFLW